MVEGKTIEEGSLTDGADWTSAGTTWNNDHYKEAFQFVDLGRELRIVHMAYTAGDANWVWKVDVDASADGKTYAPVPSLQGVDLHQKWGRQTLPDAAPFAARFLRLRYHNDGTKSSVIRMPTELSVYAGVADERWDVPSTGKVVGRGMRSVDTPARAFGVVDVGDAAPLAAGAYFVAAKVRSAGRTELVYQHCMVMPETLSSVSAASHFGLNVSEVVFAPLNRRLGVGWVRFENMKWQMVSPERGVYRYDGTVAPWYVQHDAIVDSYRGQGLSVLPFLFQSARYASSAPPSVGEDRKWSYPPVDPALVRRVLLSDRGTLRLDAASRGGSEDPGPPEREGADRHLRDLE